MLVFPNYAKNYASTIDKGLHCILPSLLPSFIYLFIIYLFIYFSFVQIKKVKKKKN